MATEQSASPHVAAVLAAAVLWGTTGTVASFAPEGSSPLLVGLATFGFGGLLLFLRSPRDILAFLRRPGTAWPWLLLGTVGIVVYPTTYYSSMSFIGVAAGNVVALGSGPLFAALLDRTLRRKPLTARWGIATAVAIVGIALLSFGVTPGGGGEAPTTGSIVAGVALGLLAGLGYAAYSVAASAIMTTGVSSAASMGAMFFAGSVVMVPWFFLADAGPLAEPRGILILIYLAVVPMALAYLAFGYGLRMLSPATATTLTLLEPLVATSLAIVIVGERLQPVGWVGFALVGAGLVVIATAGVRKSTRQSTKGREALTGGERGDGARKRS
ncbi:DMT family transporter [Mycetocola zhadangensis]|uniref:EamA family transporter n=1 Tax=Mycetocola zhadangensis TaxID=1164595 RepID=A0A3L7J6M5_9MICO|nr:EamA family transporter [Mycetocola zhadangensis]RLQ86256.1 EamA family transporter [Mycetocola zhadangensis]GGE89657.1 membrane protein [Mycetocola zhadangensis]